MEMELKCIAPVPLLLLLLALFADTRPPLLCPLPDETEPLLLFG